MTIPKKERVTKAEEQMTLSSTCFAFGHLQLNLPAVTKLCIDHRKPTVYARVQLLRLIHNPHKHRLLVKEISGSM